MKYWILRTAALYGADTVLELSAAEMGNASEHSERCTLTAKVTIEGENEFESKGFRLTRNFNSHEESARNPRINGDG